MEFFPPYPEASERRERRGVRRAQAPGGSAGAGGFTLMELLIVVAIIVLLAVIALPNMASSVTALQLTQAGQLVETQLQAARQMALANNRTVEIRFYKFAPTTGGTAYFTAFQPFVVTTNTDGTSKATPLDKPYYLPGSMIMDSGNSATDSGATLSTLLLNQPTPLMPAGLTNPQPLGTNQMNYTCETFRFNPDGSTNLVPVSNPWFVTVHAQTDGDNLKAAPRNYYTVQVSAYNGHIYDFHP